MNALFVGDIHGGFEMLDDIFGTRNSWAPAETFEAHWNNL